MLGLTTKRLLLRPLTLEDFGDLERLYGDARVMRHVTGHPRTSQQTQQRLRTHIEQHQRFGFGLCATIDRENKVFVGRCGIEPRLEQGVLVGELAWMFFPECWGQGLGGEVAQALARFGTEKLKLGRLFATAHHNNVASIAIMRKLKMTQVSQNDRGVEYEFE